MKKKTTSMTTATSSSAPQNDISSIMTQDPQTVYEERDEDTLTQALAINQLLNCPGFFINGVEQGLK